MANNREEEEFEFRLRAEQEANAAGAAEPEIPDTSLLSKAKSAGMGAAEGASMGFADELAGAAAAAGIDPTSPLPPTVQPFVQAAKYVTGRENMVDKYRAARDYVRARMGAAREANPKSFMGGQVGGGVASLLIPGMAPAKGAGMAARVGTGVLAGATQGLGASEADLTNGEVLEAAKDTGTGAAIGGLVSGATEAVAPVARFARAKVAQLAENLSGLPHWLANLARKEGPTIFKTAEGTDESILRSVDDIQDKITSYRRGAGDSYERIARDLGVSTGLREQAEDIAVHGTRQLKPDEVVRQALGLLENKNPEGRDILKSIVDVRRQLDDLVDFSNKGIQPIGGKEQAVLKNLRAALNEKMGEVTEEIGKRPMMAPADWDTDLGRNMKSRDWHSFEEARHWIRRRPFTSPVHAAEEAINDADFPQKPARAAAKYVFENAEALPTTRNIGQELRAADAEFAKAAEVYDTLRGRLDTPQKVISTIRGDLQEGVRSINPDLQALREVPGGQEAFNTARNEVARRLFKTSDGQPGGTLTLLAKTLGLTPERAGRFISASEKGLDDFIAAHPKALQYLQLLEQTAARGGQSLAVASFVLQQREPEFQAMVNDLSEGGQ